MKQRNIIFLVIGLGLLAGALLVVFLMRKKSRDENSVTVPIPDSTAQQSSTPKNTPQVVKPTGMTDYVWDQGKSTHTILAGFNRKISFYGKCVDQNGNPIGGVRIEAELLSTETSFEKYLNGPEQKREVIQLESDAFGEFKIEERTGYSVRFERIEKSGYQLSRVAELYFRFSSLVDRTGASEFRPNSKNPRIFKFWKTGNPDPLYITQVDANFDHQKNIKKVSAILLPGSINGTEQAVSVEYTIFEAYDDGFAKVWEFKISDGEFCPADVFGNLAPSDGYSTSITVRSQEDGLRRTNPNSSRFFWRSKDHKVHGIFWLNHSASRNGRGSLYFRDVRINPFGSLNLEYDPKKRIKIKK